MSHEGYHKRIAGGSWKWVLTFEHYRDSRCRPTCIMYIAYSSYVKNSERGVFTSKNRNCFKCNAFSNLTIRSASQICLNAVHPIIQHFWRPPTLQAQRPGTPGTSHAPLSVLSDVVRLALCRLLWVWKSPKQGTTQRAGLEAHVRQQYQVSLRTAQLHEHAVPTPKKHSSPLLHCSSNPFSQERAMRFFRFRNNLRGGWLHRLRNTWCHVCCVYIQPIHVCVYVHIYMYVYTYAYVRICRPTHIYIRIYIYVYKVLVVCMYVVF